MKHPLAEIITLSRGSQEEVLTVEENGTKKIYVRDLATGKVLLSSSGEIQEAEFYNDILFRYLRNFPRYMFLDGTVHADGEKTVRRTVDEILDRISGRKVKIEIEKKNGSVEVKTPEGRIKVDMEKAKKRHFLFYRMLLKLLENQKSRPKA